MLWFFVLTAVPHVQGRTQMNVEIARLRELDLSNSYTLSLKP